MRTAGRVLAAAATLVAGLLTTSIASGAQPPGWAIATAHPLATRAAIEIASAGGNAFDAAVGVSAALAVVEPMGSGLGGGGFWLLHRAADGVQVVIDGRERAPLAASSALYLDEQGEVLPRASLIGPLAAAIPGEPAALAHIAEHYGRLPLDLSLAPAVRLARQGFRATPRYISVLSLRRNVLNDEARRVLLPDGEVPAAGAVVRQPELAKTLEALARQGRDGFYSGAVADRLVTENRAAGGIWTREDLTGYRIVERDPVRGSYRGTRIASAALPSSGGVVLVQMLNMLAHMGSRAAEGSDARHHQLIEVMRRAYRDRALYLGDPDFVHVDVDRLTSTDYAAVLANDIEQSATPNDFLAPVRPSGMDTTHFSILDAEGNRVAATLSINYPFGSGFMVPGTGVLLNNEMDDFSIKPGVGNVYGLVGGRANAIEPGKRPLSSMTPTFVEAEDFVAVLGTPGGSRIISMVLLAVLELIDDGRDLTDAVDRPRFHHQYLPDVVVYEPDAFDDVLAARLIERGHTLERREEPYGNMQAVLWDKVENRLRAASDHRGEGASWTGPIPAAVP